MKLRKVKYQSQMPQNAYFSLLFSKISGGACPQTPLVKLGRFAPSRLASLENLGPLPCPETKKWPATKKVCPSLIQIQRSSFLILCYPMTDSQLYRPGIFSLKKMFLIRHMVQSRDGQTFLVAGHFFVSGQGKGPSFSSEARREGTKRPSGPGACSPRNF